MAGGGLFFVSFENKQTPKSAQISRAWEHDFRGFSCTHAPVDFRVFVIDRTSCFSVAFAQVAFTVGPAAGHRSSRHRGLEHLNSI